MKKTICLIFVFLTFSLSANNSIEHVFEEWLKYHFSAGNIGAPSKIFDKTIKLVSRNKGIEAREYLRTEFPFDGYYIDETIKILETARDKIPDSTPLLRRIFTASFSFTDHMLEKRDRDENNPPYTPEEIRSHIAEALLESLVAGESVFTRAPMAAILSAIAAVQNFQEAAHKYCENIRWEHEQESMYDRLNDSEVK